MKWADGKIRCCWANPRNERYIRYHDEEWGVPVHDDRKLFEMLILECFQAGLSWECVLNKRDAFRVAFDNFDPKKVSGLLCYFLFPLLHLLFSLTYFFLFSFFMLHLIVICPDNVFCSCFLYQFLFCLRIMI